MSQYHIYQTNHGTAYAFRSWEEAEKTFSLNDYRLVYSGEIADKVIISHQHSENSNTNDCQVLEKLFIITPENTPPLSVSAGGGMNPF